MRLLLDTHALIWWSIDHPNLSTRASDAIGDPENTVFVSAISAFEIATKHRIGKLPDLTRLARNFEAEILAEGFRELPLSVTHARSAGAMAISHKDPFDRILVTQAISESLTLVSNERLFDQFGVSRLW